MSETDADTNATAAGGRWPGDSDRQRFDGILDVAVDDDASATELLARIEHDPTAQAYAVERMVLHAALRQAVTRRRLSGWALTQTSDPSPRSVRRPAPSGARWAARRSVMAIGGSLVAVTLVVGAVAWTGLGRPYASIIRGIGTASLAAGMTLRGETHELAAGILELSSRRGARLVIEAPAAFRFESPQRLRLVRGRIAADVPPAASGFTVVTPSGEAIDLGTRFAVDVPVGGEPEVHVFEGEVVARGASSGAGTSLHGGEAFSLAANASRELRPAAFIRGDEVRELAAAVTAGREREARVGLERLRHDPALIAVVDFEESGGAATDVAGRGQCRIVQGRWPGSRAAEFVRMGDHLPIDVGGDRDWPQLTLAAWVRLDAIGAPFQSLYHTDGWEQANPGQAHWMITRPGVMRLALRDMQLAPDAVERQGFPDSVTSVLGAEGRWMHLAVVYDADRRTARFYLNGAFDSETSLAVAPPARLGAARIGNWNRNDRRLSGRIDDLVLVGRPLGDDEIRALHATGTPYPSVDKPFSGAGSADRHGMLESPGSTVRDREVVR